MNPSTLTACPAWCTVDHDAEAKRLGAQYAREGVDLSYDSDSLSTPCVGAGLTARVDDGRKVGARLVRQVDGDDDMLDLFMTLPDGREGSIDEPLSLVEAQALAAILKTLASAQVGSAGEAAS